MTHNPEALAEKGYDVYERAGDIVIDVPNPRIDDDDYFHGDNPLDSERFTEVQAGESTADAQGRVGGAGWNENAGAAVTSDAGNMSERSAEPDETWRKAELEAEAERRGVDVPSGATKPEILAALREE